jgi:anti-sigma B factor antagonist
MERQVETATHVPVVQITGRFDRMDRLVTDADIDTLVAQDPRYVVVDLARVSFMDVYGLAMLIKLLKACRQRGGDVFLAGVPARICSIFEVTRFDRVFTFYPDTTAALAAT